MAENGDGDMICRASCLASSFYVVVVDMSSSGQGGSCYKSCHTHCTFRAVEHDLDERTNLGASTIYSTVIDRGIHSTRAC